jgi:Ni,Fe-hydrogenase III small subunit/formate hydrogenlyase subunit 6/NADH:ubiquinone oxidoreductase subunit I
MIGIVKARLQQRYRTIRYPDGPAPALPADFRGRPTLVATACPDDCRACMDACPTGAFSRAAGTLRIDTGRCILCAACRNACPGGERAITFTRDHRLAATDPGGLIVDSAAPSEPHVDRRKLPGILRRSLKLRQVSAGGCNACEADVNVLATLAWDLGRFGIQFVASPRHADGLVVTGPVTRNMELALRKTYDAVPAPKIVIALGACAISGGIYREQEETCGGVAGMLPDDLYIPGCPPHPLTILDALLRFTGKIR